MKSTKFYTELSTCDLFIRVIMWTVKGGRFLHQHKNIRKHIFDIKKKNI